MRTYNGDAQAKFGEWRIFIIIFNLKLRNYSDIFSVSVYVRTTLTTADALRKALTIRNKRQIRVSVFYHLHVVVFQTVARKSTNIYDARAIPSSHVPNVCFWKARAFLLRQPRVVDGIANDMRYANF